MQSRDIIGFVILGVGGVSFLGFLILLLVLWKKQSLHLLEFEQSKSQRRKISEHPSEGISNVTFFTQSTYQVPTRNDEATTQYRGILPAPSNMNKLPQIKDNITSVHDRTTVAPIPKPRRIFSEKKSFTGTAPKAIVMRKERLNQRSSGNNDSNSCDESSIDYKETFPVELGFAEESQVNEKVESGEMENTFDAGAAGEESGEFFRGASSSVIESSFMNDNQQANQLTSTEGQDVNASGKSALEALREAYSSESYFDDGATQDANNHIESGSLTIDQVHEARDHPVEDLSHDYQYFETDSVTTDASINHEYAHHAASHFTNEECYDYGS